MPESFKHLLEGNHEWVEKTLERDPHFFEELSKGQHPNFLWIGCADSRVPASQITNAIPGSLFVQRNIANMVIHTDTNLLSVVNYAVKHLHVKHIIVCGHYGCGGVKAAMSDESFGFLDSWLLHIKSVYHLHSDELDAIEDEEKRFDRFVELNVLEQANNLARIPFIQEEWEKDEYPYIHSWVYDLRTGDIKNLKYIINSNQKLGGIFQYHSKVKTKV